ncbi:endonuclease domain-containing protein [Streptomyces sp. NPDC051546]|uniref:endonuclease domain-containing protein n=1 Tax=Streptomyces sp. NPDC051546 TaxID=3365655 RepID=UPI0037934AF6
MTADEREQATNVERAVLTVRNIAVPERWSLGTGGVWPCRLPRSPRRRGEGPLPPLPLARRPRDEVGLFHLWDPRQGLLQRCGTCLRLPEGELGEPVATVLVPYRLRCNPWRPGWATHVRRRVAGPLRRQWPHEKIPRWFVWWRLFELQDGRCARCWFPARMVDHDHRSGRVRGLLCHDCNSREGPYSAGRTVCVHEPPYCFEDYWADPPATPFGWSWPPGSRRTPETFRHSLWPEITAP